MNIRPAQASDMAEIAAIYAPFVNDTVITFELAPPPTAGDIEQRWRALVDEGYPYLVAIDSEDGSVLGYAYAGRFRGRAAYRFTVESSVYVAEKARRRGIGSALMRALIKQCESQGFTQMVAVITDASETEASQEFHRNLDFFHIGVMPQVGFKFDRWLAIVIMQRALGVEDH